MGYRFDSPLIASAYHFGNRGLGVLGSQIPSTGTNGAGYLYNDLSLPADANKQYSGYIVTRPSVGTFFAYEDSSFTYSGPSTTFVYKLREDGVDKGNQTVTINVGAVPAVSSTISFSETSDVFLASANFAAAGVKTATLNWAEQNDTFSAATNFTPSSDSVAPAMQGSLAISGIVSDGFTTTWQAATDNVATTGYEFSTDNGSTYISVGNVLSYTKNGLAASTLFNVKVRAYDAAGNRSTPLSTAATTSAGVGNDTTAPSLTGSITVTNITTGGFTATWPSATDNVGVAGYEISIDSGTPAYVSVGNVLTSVKTGLPSATQFNIRVRAYDAAGNRSAALTTTVTTATAGTYATSVTITFQDRSNTLKANLTGMKWAFFDQTTPDNLSAPSAKGTLATTNSSGVAVLNITGTQLPPGATGWLIFSNSDGTATQSNLISFAGPCVVA